MRNERMRANKLLSESFERTHLIIATTRRDDGMARRSIDSEAINGDPKGTILMEKMTGL